MFAFKCSETELLKIKDEGGKKTENQREEKLSSGNFERIFIPVNHHNTHWTLLVSNILYILRYKCHGSPRV